MIEILFEDDQLLVVNKPPGMLSVPGRGPDKQDSVQTRCASLYPQALVIHRLDCATSGVMLFAKTKAAQSELSRQFCDRETEKEYHAVTYGDCPAAEGEIDFPLITDWPNRPRQKICYQTGKPSLTRYQLLKHSTSGNCLRLTPVTGRSHQLRVHMMAIGMPIVGDTLYAPAHIAQMSPRLMLHAYRLSFTHPRQGQRIRMEAPLPF